MGKTLYRGNNLFTGEHVIHTFGMVVEGGKIVRMGDYDESLSSDCEEVIDFEDRFVIPGLIDSHVHLTSDPDVEEQTPRIHQLLEMQFYGIAIGFGQRNGFTDRYSPMFIDDLHNTC